jgi:Reverse transcriptase (RNA-dependent DNA polymerase)
VVYILYEMLGGNFDKSMTEETIVLVKNEKRNTIAAFRPISLLNYDYKLLTKIIKIRMEDILPTIISDNQTACNKNLNITTALCKIRDKIAEYNKQEIVRFAQN